MKQLGNLAVLAASKNDCVLQIYDGEVTLHAGSGPDRRCYVCSAGDDESIEKLVSFLNFGTLVEVNEKIKKIR